MGFHVGPGQSLLFAAVSMSSPETDVNDLPEDIEANDEVEAGDGVAGDGVAGDEVASESEEKQPLTLDVAVQSPSACQRHVTVTIPREDIERYFKAEFSELAPTAAVPGFRPGRAPRKLVESRFREQVADKVKGALLMDSLEQISREHEFSAISEPDFNFGAIELPEEGPFKFEFDIEVRPEFVVPNWKGLAIVEPTREFDDSDVDRQLKVLLSRTAELTTKEGAAEAGDQVTLDITFRHNGEIISEVEGESVKIQPELSFRDAMLPEFEKLMVGASQGDRRHAKVTIGANSESEALRGQDVDVEIEVLEVETPELPKLTAKFLDEIGGFRDEDDLRGAVREELQRQFNYFRRRKIREQITAKLTEGANWELPPELLKRQAKRELQRAVLELKAAGIRDEDIKSHSNAIRQNSTASTAKALKEHFILERIAEDENIDAEPKDYDDEIELIADQGSESPRRVRARLEKRGEMDTLRNQIVERKVIELICSHATFTHSRADTFGAPPVAAIDHAIGGRDETEIPEAKHGGDAQPLQQPAERP